MSNELSPSLFDFFSNPDFSRCFFSGQDVSINDKISVFPEWLLTRYALHDKFMGMLNWNRVKYGELFIPCHPSAKARLDVFEREIQSAFESGFEAVKDLDLDTVFRWMARLQLGVLYHDIHYTIELGRKRNRPFSLSPLLRRKYTDLHFMMQSIVSPVRWERRPYSMVVKKLNYSKDIFNFRDETKNQNFSLAMNGFGLVACLQDQGANLVYHEELLRKMNDATLHAIQFEELCARFIYSNYLLRQHHGFTTIYENGCFIMRPVDEIPISEFAPWEDKMFASVLEDYFKPWGLEPKDIYTFPDSPISFLINENSNEFIVPEEISLPG